MSGKESTVPAEELAERRALGARYHEQYAGKPLHTGYCNKMMQNVNKWDRCLYEPKEVQP